MQIGKRYNLVTDNDENGLYKSHYRDINGKTFCFMAVQVGDIWVVNVCEVRLAATHTFVGTV